MAGVIVVARARSGRDREEVMTSRRVAWALAALSCLVAVATVAAVAYGRASWRRGERAFWLWMDEFGKSVARMSLPGEGG